MNKARVKRRRKSRRMRGRKQGDGVREVRGGEKMRRRRKMRWRG
jgi:hypothetical protein